MKKTLFFLLFSNFIFAQNFIDVRLANGSVGTPNESCCQTTYPFSNDDGLNAILELHNVLRYQYKAGHPYESYNDRMVEIQSDSDISQLIIDLNAYSSVVEHVVISDYGTFKDALKTKILDPTTGIPTGTNGNIIVTNDTGLNQIFEDYNVFYYVQDCPSCNNPENQKVYSIVCDCDNDLLKAALDSYTSVIQTGSTEYVGAAYLLGNSAFNSSKTAVYPNPFSSNITIESNENITSFSIFDITGKQLINSNSKSDLDNQTSKLIVGIYLLKLQFENGQNANYKLVKN